MKLPDYDPAKRIRSYYGRRRRSPQTSRCEVTVLPAPTGFHPLQDEIDREVANHSPTGWEWGYGGSGPCQLAADLLYAHFKHYWGASGEQAVELANRWKQWFKDKFVSTWHGDTWQIADDQLAREIRAEHAAMTVRGEV